MNRDEYYESLYNVQKKIAYRTIVPKGALKIHLDRVKKRYGWTGGKLEDLSKLILTHNYSQITNRVAEISTDRMNKAVSKLNKAGKKIVMPELADVLPAKSVHIIKAAQNGALIKDTLRDQLNKALRKVMTENNILTPTGAKAGQINNNLVKQFEAEITKVYSGYVKKGKNGEMPTNIKTIATTEVRSTVGMMKEAYINKLSSSNSNIKVYKRWIHNKSLALNPSNIRKGHFQLNWKEIPVEKPFNVKVFDSKGKYVETILMQRPHDPNAPIGQKAGCHCDVEYFVRVVK